MKIEEVKQHAQYIGGGVYLIDKAFDGYHYWLITSDGIDIQNRIALDRAVVPSLLQVLMDKLENS